MAAAILVVMKVDNGGTTSVLCTGLLQDPLFPEKVVLDDVQVFSWPFGEKWLKMKQWSVDKDAVVNWMCGEMRDTFEITPELLKGGSGEVPWPPNSSPHSDLVNHPDELEELTSSSEPPEKSSEPPPKEPASGLPGLSETPSEEPEGDG